MAVPVNRLPYGGTWNGIVGVREVSPASRTRYVGPLPTSTTVAQINSHLSPVLLGNMSSWPQERSISTAI